MNEPTTHSARPGEPLTLCGVRSWTVRIVPEVVEPTCGTCRRIRAFRKSHARRLRGRPRR